MVPVAARIELIHSMSAHADSQEILRWLRGFKAPPKRTFVVHGEPAAMQTLQDLIKRELSWETHAPAWNEKGRA